MRDEPKAPTKHRNQANALDDNALLYVLRPCVASGGFLHSCFSGCSAIIRPDVWRHVTLVVVYVLRLRCVFLDVLIIILGEAKGLFCVIPLCNFAQVGSCFRHFLDVF